MDRQPLSWKDGIEVKVKLIVTHKKPSRPDHHQSLENCLQCMRGMITSVGCTIDLSQYRLPKMKRVHGCIILSCTTECGETSRNVPIRITKTTAIKIADVQSLEAYTAQTKQRHETIVGGLDDERKFLSELLLHVGNRSPAVLVKGPPGCGKTSLVKQVALDCDAALLAVDCRQLMNLDPGLLETKLASLFSKADNLSKELPCILFFDQMEVLYYKRERNFSVALMTGALTDQIKLIPRVKQGCGLLVVIATNKPLMLDPCLLRHDVIASEIILPVPSLKKRQQILKVCLHDMPLADDVNIHSLSMMMSGCVCDDIKKMCSQVASAKWRVLGSSQSDRTDEWKITMADFIEECHHFKPSLMRGEESIVDVRPVAWSDIGGLDEVKLQIQQAVEWPLKYAEAFKALGLPLTKGVLLTGPPGCGKTTLARAAATACKVTFISLSCAQVFSPYVGDSEKKIAETFQKARMLAPSILFLDEIDAIVGKRSDAGSSVAERVLSTLLNELDGFATHIEYSREKNLREMELEGARGEPDTTKITSARELIEEERDRHVMVIAATNRPDMIDDALKRPGRIDRIIYVPPPDLKGRLQAFSVHSKKMPLADDVNINELAARTEGCSGADIMGICTEAGALALSSAAVCVTKAHFDMVLQEY